MGRLTEGWRRLPKGTFARLNIALNDFSAVSALKPELLCATVDWDRVAACFIDEGRPNSSLSSFSSCDPLCAAIPGSGVTGGGEKRGVYGSKGGGGGVVDGMW